MHAIHVATLPQFGDILRSLTVDSMPAFHPMLLRLWTSLGWVEQDAGLRFLGLLVAISTLVVVWIGARSLGVGVPLLTLVLFDLHRVVLQTAGSLKPYGVGIVFLYLVFAGLWRVASAPGAGAILWTGTVAILAVNTVYQNAPFLVALCLAAATARVVVRDWAGVRRVFVVALMAAASLLPYAGVIVKSQDWRPLNQPDNTVGQFVTRLADIFADWSRALLVVWILSCAVAVFGAVRALRRRGLGDREPLLYAALAAIGAVFLFVGFFRAAARDVGPWHAASLIGLTTLCLDLVLVKSLTLRSLRFGLAVAAAAVMLPSSSQWVGVRQTNVDLLATYLQNAARPGDAIVVTPWFLGVTFNHYYRGQVPWMTIPPIADLYTHRYDLVKIQMMAAEPLTPVYHVIGLALESGHRVWLVGGLQFSKPGEVPVPLPPAPAAPSGWRDTPYYDSWSHQAGHFVQSHADQLGVVQIQAGQPVWLAEDIVLMMAEGWRRAEGSR